MDTFALLRIDIWTREDIGVKNEVFVSTPANPFKLVSMLASCLSHLNQLYNPPL